MAGLYNPSGHVRVTVVDGTAVTGLWAPDGSMNVYNATDAVGVVGLWHPCGAVNMVSTDGTSLVGRYARNGAINAVNDSSYKGSNHPSGALNVTGFIGSEASELLREWGPDGLVLDFTDDFFFNSTGFYGSAAIAGGGSQDGYNSSPTQAASSLLAYASPSAKLTRGPDGNFRYQAHNICTSSNNIGSGWVLNLVTATDAETATSTNANSGIWFVATVLGGASYAFSFMAKRGTMTDVKYSIFDQTNGADIVSATSYYSSINSADFTLVTVTFTAPATCTAARCYLLRDSGTLGTTFFKNMHVRRTPSDSTFLTTSGSARYALPLEWDSSGELNGLLVEEARTNICLHNRNLLGSGWSNLTVTPAKDATGIDGIANSASSLTSSGTNGYFYRIMNNLSPNTLYTLSAYVRRKTGSGAVYLSPDFLYATGVLGTESVTGPNLSTNGDFATNDLTGWTSTVTGTGTNDASSGACSMAAGTGTAMIHQTIAGTRGKLYRVTFDIVAISGSLTAGRSNNSPAFTTTGTKQIIVYALETGSIVFRFRLATATHTATIDNIVVQEIVGESLEIAVTGNYQRFTRTFKTVDNGGVQSISPAFSFATSGDAVEVDCIQIEAGGFATSPIETFASSVTRAADDFGLATSAYPHSATVGTAMIEYVPDSVTSAMVALRLDNNTADEVISIGHDASANIGLTVTDGGAAQTGPLTSGTATAGAVERIAVSWKANDFLLSDNGATAVADTSGTLPTVTSLDLGPTMSGQIKRIVIVPYERSAAEVEALATAE